MASRNLIDDEITEIFFNYEDSEDGFKDDGHRIINLDFVPNLEIPFEETQEFDIDNIIENATLLQHLHNQKVLHVIKVEKKIILHGEREI